MDEKSKNYETSLKSSKKSLTSVIYTLELPNLFSLPCSIHLKDSPTFKFAKATWCFRFYKAGRPISDIKKYFDVSIVRMTSEIVHHKIFYTITLRDIKGFKYDDFYNVDVFDEDNQEHGLAHFIEKSKKKKKRKAKKWLTSEEENTLKLTCELFCDETERVDVLPHQEGSNQGAATLCQDLKNLFLNGENHDLILKTPDKEFKVHQNILMARSEVFKAMLSYDTIEKKSGVVDAPDCFSEAMEQFLYYVYTGKAESLNQDNMLELYYVADKYSVIFLKEECTDMIKKSLSASNICDVIRFSLNHSDDNLLECATEYFVNNTTDILPTVEWMSFMKSNMIAANELLIKASSKWDIGKS